MKKEGGKKEGKKEKENTKGNGAQCIYIYFEVYIYECACYGVVQSDVVCDVLSTKQSSLCVVSAAIWAASMSKESCLFIDSELY